MLLAFQFGNVVACLHFVLSVVVFGSLASAFGFVPLLTTRACAHPALGRNSLWCLFVASCSCRPFPFFFCCVPSCGPSSHAHLAL